MTARSPGAGLPPGLIPDTVEKVPDPWAEWLGGYTVGFSRSNRQASTRNYLMALTRDGKLLH